MAIDALDTERSTRQRMLRKISAVGLPRDLSLIEAWARELQPAIIHLGAAPELLSPDDAAALKGKLPGILVMRTSR